MTPAVAWRSLPHRALLLTCAGALALVAGLAPRWDSGEEAVLPLLGAAALLAGAVGRSVDDAAAAVLASSPATLRRRVLVPVAVTTALVGLAWAAALGVAVAVVDGVPALGLTLLLAGLSAFAVAVGAGLRRWHGDAEPGAVVAPVVVVALLAATRLPADWALVAVAPAGAGWDAAAQRWVVAGAVCAVVVGVATRDPAARARVGRQGLEP